MNLRVILLNGKGKPAKGTLALAIAFGIFQIEIV